MLKRWMEWMILILTFFDMSARGRGRGRGGVVGKSDDRSSSSSSSRNSSLTRTGSSSTTTSTTHDTNRLIKELGSGAGGPSFLGASSSSARSKFTPNLAASRKTDIASTPSPSISTSNTSTENKIVAVNGNKLPIGHSGGAHQRRGGRGNVIQTAGLFDTSAQIPTASPSPSGARLSSSVKGENSTSSSRMTNVKKVGAITTEKRTLIGDVDGLKYEIDEEYEPRQIPIAERKSVFDIKQEPGVAKSKVPIVVSSTSHIDSFVHLFQQQKLESSTSKPLIKDEPIEPTTFPSELLSSPPPAIDSSQLILMQFPDVLPCIRTSSSSSSKPELVSLTDLPDGFLGKLQIFKSGKCRLKLSADTYLDVDIERPTSFLQNVMVTDMTTTTNTDATTNGDMNKLICLGDIKHKLTVSLNVDHVLEDTR